MSKFDIIHRSRALMLTMCNRLSNDPGIIGVIVSGYDKTIAKFHNSPTIYVLFTRVSFMKVASRLCRILLDETQMLLFITS